MIMITVTQPAALSHVSRLSTLHFPPNRLSLTRSLHYYRDPLLCMAPLARETSV